MYERKRSDVRAVRAHLRGSGSDPSKIDPQNFAELVDLYRTQRYVQNNWNDLLRQYQGRYVAFVNGQYLADASTREELGQLISQRPIRKHVFIMHMVPGERRNVFPTRTIEEMGKVLQPIR